MIRRVLAAGEAAAPVPLVEAPARGTTGPAAAPRRPPVLAVAAPRQEVAALAAPRTRASASAGRAIARGVAVAGGARPTVAPARKAAGVTAPVADGVPGSPEVKTVVGRAPAASRARTAAGVPAEVAETVAAGAGELGTEAGEARGIGRKRPEAWPYVKKAPAVPDAVRRPFVAVAPVAIAQAVAPFPLGAGIAPGEGPRRPRQVIPTAAPRRVVRPVPGQVRPEVAAEAQPPGLNKAVAVAPATSAHPSDMAASSRVPGSFPAVPDAARARRAPVTPILQAAVGVRVVAKTDLASFSHEAAGHKDTKREEIVDAAAPVAAEAEAAPEALVVVPIRAGLEVAAIAPRPKATGEAIVPWSRSSELVAVPTARVDAEVAASRAPAVETDAALVWAAPFQTVDAVVSAKEATDAAPATTTVVVPAAGAWSPGSEARAAAEGIVTAGGVAAVAPEAVVVAQEAVPGRTAAEATVAKGEVQAPEVT